MKPKTKIQKEVARLSANLRPISATQIDWAYRHCVEHIGYRTKKGNITCSDCGHEWHSDSGLCDTLEGCTCPKCHAELKVQDTRRRIYKETQNFSVITTCKGYQVIRVAQVRCESRKGEPMRFYCHEVVQRWISPDGKVTDMALLRGFLFCYCDVWALGSDMEVRPHNSLYDDVVARSCAYPKMRILPQLRRNGFKGDFHGISPVRLFKALLSDPRIETLMKGGEIEVMKHFLFNTRTADECWASYLIAKRHKYQIDNLSMWCDYLRMLKKLGQDLRNPKNICPEDFMAAHDNATRKIEAIHEKERAAEQRRWEIERREREQQRQLQRKKDAEDFIANKSKFFGLVITDEEIIVKVLESIDEYYNEGKTQGICVFGSGYYKKADDVSVSDPHVNRVMVVEDDPEMSRYIEMSLSDVYHVKTFNNAVEALDGIDAFSPQLIISDVLMPGMTGFEFCQKVKGNIKTSHIPFLLLTGVTDKKSILEGMRLGAIDYIAKPFDKEVLRSKIANIFELRQAAQRQCLEELKNNNAVELSNKADNEFMEKLLKLIETNIDNPELNIQMMCSELAMSRTLLYNKITQLTGKSPTEFIRIFRLKQAAALLLSGEYSVTDVAFKVGIDNPKYFSRIFKEFYGVSPKEYLAKRE